VHALVLKPNAIKPASKPRPAADLERGRHPKTSVREHDIASQGALVTEIVKPMLDCRPVNPLIIPLGGVGKLK
jgi:hypothetical protein